MNKRKTALIIVGVGGSILVYVLYQVYKSKTTAQTPQQQTASPITSGGAGWSVSGAVTQLFDSIPLLQGFQILP